MPKETHDGEVESDKDFCIWSVTYAPAALTNPKTLQLHRYKAKED
jgi:hypothetical protein